MYKPILASYTLATYYAHKCSYSHQLATYNVTDDSCLCGVCIQVAGPL